MAKLLGKMVRDGVKGELGWLDAEAKYLKIVSQKFSLMEKFLFKKRSLGEEEGENLQEIYIQFMLLWEDSHHECKRTGGRRTCLESEITPGEAAVRLLGVFGEVLRGGEGGEGERGILREVSNHLSENVVF